jgi:hypothetical protein
MALPRSVQIQRIREVLLSLDRADDLLSSLSFEGVLMGRIHLLSIKSSLARVLNREYPIDEHIVALASSMVSDAAGGEEGAVLDQFFTPGPRLIPPPLAESVPQVVSRANHAPQAGPRANHVPAAAPPPDNFDLMPEADFEQRKARVSAQARRKRQSVPVARKYPDLTQRRISGAYWDADQGTVMCSECRAPVDSHPVDENLPPHPDGRLPLRLCSNEVVVYGRRTLDPPGSQGAS